MTPPLEKLENYLNCHINEDKQLYLRNMQHKGILKA